MAFLRKIGLFYDSEPPVPNSGTRTCAERQMKILTARFFTVTLLALLPPLSVTAIAAQSADIGLATSGAVIDVLTVEARQKNAPVVVLIGGLKGNDSSAAAV